MAKRDLTIIVTTSIATVAVLSVVWMAWTIRRRSLACRESRWKASKCTQCSGGPDSKWGFLMDPMHNVKEVVRNCALLEIHLAKERCIDCITKHALIISGLIDEGICLANDPIYRQKPYVTVLKSCASDMRDIEQGLFKGKDAPVETAYKLRKMRKRLMPIVNGDIDAKTFNSYPTFDPHVCSCDTSSSRQTRQVATDWFA